MQTAHIDAATLQEIHARTSFGAIKCVIGSDHEFTRKIPTKITVPSKDKDKPKEITVEREETVFRKVRSVHQHAGYPKHWVALGTTLMAETEDELLAQIYAIHGGPEAMRKAGKQVLYCAESLVDVDVWSTENGSPVLRKEITLLSDREPG